MKVAFIADPVSSFNRKSETTFFLAHEFCKQNVSCYFAQINGLFLENETLYANMSELQITRSTKTGFFDSRIISKQTIDLSTMDCVWLRKDPPIDLNYIDHLSLIEKLNGKTRLINNPTGIKRAPEKILALSHKGLSPQTLIAQNTEIILAFIKKHKKVVLKPLNLSGGRGIVVAEHGQVSLRSLVDILTHDQTTFICVQKFVPKANLGDKRVLIWQEQILGCFLRKPGKEDFRGNMHSGATYHKTKLSSDEMQKVKILLPELKSLGLDFVGIDMIGGQITEVNVTSPMGLGELNHLYSYQSEKTVVRSLLLS